MMNFKTLCEVLSHSSQPDLEIVCTEDNQKLESHKILFAALLNEFWGELFLLEDSGDSKTTLIVPGSSESIKLALESIALGSINVFHDFFDNIFGRPSCPKSDYMKTEFVEENTAEDNVEPEALISSNNKAEDNVESETLMPLNNNVEVPNVKRKKRRKVKVGGGQPQSEPGEIKSNEKYNRDSNQSDEKILCPNCGKGFRSNFNYSTHKSRCGEKQAEKLCPDCGQEFTGDYSYHKYRCAKTVCEICGTEVFSYCYQIHLKTHGPRELKKCPICGKEGLIDLKIHIRRHKYDGLRGKCNLCHKEMTQYSLKKHMKNVHQERKYRCFQCEYKATSKYNLNLHITKMHQVVEEFIKRKCQYCELETTNMTRHMKYHPEHLKDLE